MNADRAAEAAEALADLSPAALKALQALRRAANRAETASDLVVAFDVILGAHDSPTIPAAVFAALIEALKAARDAAVDVLHPTMMRPKLHACIEAAAGLVCFWSMALPERARVMPTVRSDSAALVRIFRNTVESLLLVEQLHAHAAERRQSIVDRIKLDALSGSSMTGGVDA